MQFNFLVTLWKTWHVKWWYLVQTNFYVMPVIFPQKYKLLYFILGDVWRDGELFNSALRTVIKILLFYLELIFSDCCSRSKHWRCQVSKRPSKCNGQSKFYINWRLTHQRWQFQRGNLNIKSSLFNQKMHTN